MRFDVNGLYSTKCVFYLYYTCILRWNHTLCNLYHFHANLMLLCSGKQLGNSTSHAIFNKSRSTRRIPWLYGPLSVSFTDQPHGTWCWHRLLQLGPLSYSCRYRIFVKRILRMWRQYVSTDTLSRMYSLIRKKGRMTGLYKWKLSYKVPIASQFYLSLLSRYPVYRCHMWTLIGHYAILKLKDKLCTCMVWSQHISSITRIIKR
jgi:hypothetical protein